ncbi:MAG: hypothetical protein ACE5MI_11445 [Acidimicrobiia bacterium]
MRTLSHLDIAFRRLIEILVEWRRPGSHPAALTGLEISRDMLPVMGVRRLG